MQQEMTRPFSGTETPSPAHRSLSPQGISEIKATEQESIGLQVKELETMLIQSSQAEHRVNLEARKNQIPFRESTDYAALKARLDAVRTPLTPRPTVLPPEPIYIEPEVGFGQVLLFKKKRILRAAEDAHAKKMESWHILMEKLEKAHAQQSIQHQESLSKAEAERKVLQHEIEAAEIKYEKERARQNEALELLRINYRSRDPHAVADFLHEGLLQNPPPSPFTQNFSLEYHRENHVLFVSMELPHPNAFPRQKETVIDPSTKQQRITEYSPEAFAAMYNDACYQFILRVLHELLSYDEEQVVEAVRLQAWVHHLNRGNGQMEKLCVATLYASAADLAKINFAQVDPALCFRYLKGVSAPSLADLLPVPAQFAIAEKNTEQPGAPDLIEPLDDSNNLASMHWTDMEKLVTGLFCREFGQLEGGLDILQSSPEHGLDAAGTDADLFRGGRFLFMVRRSNKPLTVSMVRELFGMVIHEGANKGILVTTSDFTPEAYAFAEHKPITLVNGNSLLSLFEKHGQRFRINLREAVSLASLLR